MRRITFVFWPFLIFLLRILWGEDVLLLLASGQCLADQKSLLLMLKGNLTVTNPPTLPRWNDSIDCCQWDGVQCDISGHVIKLELVNQAFSGEIADSSTLFDLQHLESLNLAFNNFNSSIPSGLYKLTNLTYLNLSAAGFVGQIPGDLGRMKGLVTLDLSNRFPGNKPLKTENLNLRLLFENLTELREVYLDGVNISAPGTEWCNALSSLSNLRVLSLSTCSLSGPIDPSLLKLSSLSVLILDINKLSTTVPDFFASFSNLTTLSLSSCHLQGEFPGKILQVQTLQNLDLSINKLISGVLPEFPQNGSLRTLALSYTKFSGLLPGSIGFLRNLSKIDLSNCNFTGPIPPTLANLTGLFYLDFSSNQFNGSIPSFQMSRNLKYIDLSRNQLMGTIRSSHFEGLEDLSVINLGDNSLGGSIPPSLFTLQSLQTLQLANNRFERQIPEFPNASSSRLDTVDLTGNQLQGSIPKSFFELGSLNVLSLSFNSFNGTLPLEMIKNLRNLTRLELSYNNLSIDASITNSSQSSFPKLSILKLASCKLRAFPNLETQTKIIHLDLSDNEITGDIPRWVWEVGEELLEHLNLSCNKLSGLQNNYTVHSLLVLDLHSNQLQGNFPFPPATAIYVDYSSNNFSNSISPVIGISLSNTVFFSLSNNSLTGPIPESICNGKYVQVLDLSDNALTGTIPQCLFDSMPAIKVLHLGSNKLTGTIPDNFPANCALRTLDLSRNNLGGQIPGSLVNCAQLEVLNIGSNKIEDTFPCMLKNSSSLRVLVLRSNMFGGNLSCPPANNGWQNLQIIDIALNNFSGALSSTLISDWKGMLSYGQNGQSAQDHLSTDFLNLSKLHYQDTVTVTFKGLELALVKILTVFTSIDFSCNNFEGDIPDAVGELKALYGLNLSQNSLSGGIPNSIGKLMQLESLDLSRNQLTGMIPSEIASLTFLQVLNLSFNQLSGRIPSGTQFQTFTDTSFEGNIGLCGFPLNTSCNDNAQAPEWSRASKDAHTGSDTTFEWQFIFTGLGFGVGAAVILAPLIVSKEVRDRCDEQLGKTLPLIFPRYNFCYTGFDEGKVEPGKDLKDETEESDDDEEEDEHEGGDEAFRGKYCVFCSKLDLLIKKAVHDPRCTCHSAPPPATVYLTSPKSSSSSLLILYRRKF